MNTTYGYGACMAALGCRVLTPVVNGIIWPASVTPSVETWDKLVDGQSSTVYSLTAPAVGMGVRTTAAQRPYITLQLDSAYGAQSKDVHMGAWTNVPCVNASGSYCIATSGCIHHMQGIARLQSI